jgi:hypothetical protein
LLAASVQNYDLVFHQYAAQYRRSIWNTSELAAVIADFARSPGGSPDSAWVLPYPHWVDTRLVGVEAGYPVKDYALPRQQLEGTLRVAPPKLFLVSPEDVDGLAQLRALYPSGESERYVSKYGRDFWLYLVAPPPVGR